MNLRLFLVLSISAFASSLAAPTFAQRGASYDGQAKPWSSTSQGFPGYFDTNVARRGSIVVDFPPAIFGIYPLVPFIAVDYGVTETLTVGTNAAVTTIPWLIGGQGAALKVRSLMIGDETEQAAATYYGGILSLGGENSFTAYYHLMTWNHAWRLGGRHTLSAHGNYTRVNYEQAQENELRHASVSLISMMAGGGYGFEISPRWTLRSNAVLSLYQSIEADTVAISFNQSSSIRKVKSTTLIGVAQVEYHPVDKWLFGAGVSGFSVAGANVAIPWLSTAKRW